jgi:hypothetical protein
MIGIPWGPIKCWVSVALSAIARVIHLATRGLLFADNLLF